MPVADGFNKSRTYASVEAFSLTYFQYTVEEFIYLLAMVALPWGVIADVVMPVTKVWTICVPAANSRRFSLHYLKNMNLINLSLECQAEKT